MCNKSVTFTLISVIVFTIWTVCDARVEKFYYREVRNFDASDTAGNVWDASINHKGVHLCYGAIITSSHILTTATCVTRDEHLKKGALMIRVGASEFGGDPDYLKLSENVTHHPNYNRSTISIHNVAVVKLQSKITQKNAREIPLSTKTKPGDICYFYEWQETTRLFPRIWVKELGLLKMQGSKCNEVAGPTETQVITNYVLCTETYEPQKNQQEMREEGTPLICNNALAGIFLIHAALYYPTIQHFINATYYIPWLQELTAGEKLYLDVYAPKTLNRTQRTPRTEL